MTRPSEGAPTDDHSLPVGARIKRGRADILARTDLDGRALNRALSDDLDRWFEHLAVDLPAGWALAATGGYGRRQLFPGSDADVALIHPRTVSADAAAETARTIWYPIWDGGVKLSPAVHTDRSLRQLAGDDVVTLTSLFDIRPLAGDGTVVASIARSALDTWRKRPWKWLAALGAANEARWHSAGDVASHLEPNLKDGRGGLRDLDALRWALAVNRTDVDQALDVPLTDLVLAATPLIEARCALHRVANRPINTLGLHDQDEVAAVLGIGDADRLMLGLSAAARHIEWSSGRFWRRVGAIVERSGRRRRSAPRGSTALTAQATVRDGEVDLLPHADINDPALAFQTAAAAAHHGASLANTALVRLAGGQISNGAPWDEPTRRAFLSLLGAGPRLVDTIEDLDYHGLIVRAIPEWQAIRNLPQRNAFHRYTVDRHLLETVAEANHLLRTVARPDLLLTAALLHDIGKGRADDHTALGVTLTRTIAARMGFDPADIDTLAMLVDAHLLLAETATRRDLDDPRTAQLIAERVGTLDNLALLRALTEADGRATGPTSWTAWKHHLVDILVRATSELLGGDGRSVESSPTDAAWRDTLTDLARRATSAGHIEVERFPGPVFDGRSARQPDVVVVAAPDRTGLFATIAAAFALHRVPVLGADVHTTADGTAVDQFRVADGDTVNWHKLTADLRRASTGDIDLDGAVRQRLARPSLRRRRAAAAAAPNTEVLIDNLASTTSTVIDVRSPDAEAVLYRLAVVLRDHGLDVHTAKVATLGHEIVDVFYVRRSGMPAAPQIPEAEHATLRAALISALADHGDPAASRPSDQATDHSVA